MHLPLINTILFYFFSIRDLVGRKIYLFLFINIILGFLEGLGLALIIPLFFVLQNKNEADSKWLGLIKAFFRFLNLDFTIGRFFSLVIIVFLISRILALFSYRFDATLFSKSQSIIFKKTLKSYEKMSYSYFTQFNSGHFNNIFQNETNRAIAAIQYYTKSLNNLCMTVALFLLALNNNFVFSLSIAFFSAIVFFIFSKVSRETKKISYQLSIENGQFQMVSIEFLNNFKYLVSTNSFKSFTPYIHQCCEKVTFSKYRMKILTDRLNTYTMMIILPGLAGLIYLFIEVFGYPVETILVSIVVCQRALTKGLTFQGSWQIFNNVLGSYKFLTKNLDLISQNSEKSEGIIIPSGGIEIQFKNIEFSFNNDFKIKISNLVFPKNKIISLVGTSGSGKTTMLDLISGIYTPQSGTVDVNGDIYKDINIRKFRELIGFVNQENSLFNDTVFNNVSNWDDNNLANQEKVIEACRLANIDLFINGLDNKYETLIGEKGIKVSGGQRQRITIARELYKNPRLLLLDEATSALDSESEQKIKETIESLRGKMTIVIVAHRLSTVRNSDKIVVFGSGLVIEEGTYEQLVNLKDSRFKEIVNSQLIKE